MECTHSQHTIRVFSPVFTLSLLQKVTASKAHNLLTLHPSTSSIRKSYPKLSKTGLEYTCHLSFLTSQKHADLKKPVSMAANTMQGNALLRCDRKRGQGQQKTAIPQTIDDCRSIPHVLPIKSARHSCSKESTL
jgi:hypothetical protein